MRRASQPASRAKDTSPQPAPTHPVASMHGHAAAARASRPAAPAHRYVEVFVAQAVPYPDVLQVAGVVGLRGMGQARWVGLQRATGCKQPAAPSAAPPLCGLALQRFRQAFGRLGPPAKGPASRASPPCSCWARRRLGPARGAVAGGMWSHGCVAPGTRLQPRDATFGWRGDTRELRADSARACSLSLLEVQARQRRARMALPTRPSACLSAPNPQTLKPTRQISRGGFRI